MISPSDGAPSRERDQRTASNGDDRADVGPLEVPDHEAATDVAGPRPIHGAPNGTIEPPSTDPAIFMIVSFDVGQYADAAPRVTVWHDWSARMSGVLRPAMSESASWTDSAG
jgi:hypothetical protein